ncbi:MAG: redoxin domain-containing protein [Chloroflexia bacterium]|nr:redoxin domain-containing protein [Chloroflexia bacterium]
MHLTQLRQSYFEFKALGVEFVTAANDTPEVNQELRERLDLPFTLLSDIDAEVARKYRAFHENEPRDRKIALTSMFLIDSAEHDRIVRFEYVGPTTRHRVPNSRLLEEILNLRGQREQLISVLVPGEEELLRQIEERNNPPLGFYRQPPKEEIEGSAVLEREVLGQMVMSQYEEIHRYMREGWRLVTVLPETHASETIGQRYVFERVVR